MYWRFSIVPQGAESLVNTLANNLSEMGAVVDVNKDQLLLECTWQAGPGPLVYRIDLL